MYILHTILYVHGARVHLGCEQKPREPEEDGISFETVTKVFLDPKAIVRVGDHDAEQRWQTIGSIDTEGFPVVLVAHTLISHDSGELIRIISARKATPRERRLYEEGN